MAFEFVLYDKVNRVATITMNRPEKLNALSGGLRRDIASAVEEAEKDPDARCILLTGAGRAFSSGGDIGGDRLTRLREQTFDEVFEEFGGSRSERTPLREASKPLIGVINGLCYGAALMMSLQLDFRIASDRARFCFIEARMGAPGPANAPMIIGADWTKRLLFTGEIIDAQRALQIGLVTEVLPHDQLMEKAQELGERIAAMPPKGVRFNKMAINGAMHAMGLDMLSQYVGVLSGITTYLSMGADVEAPDGRPLQEIQAKEGFKAFLKARNDFFDRPWP